MACVIIGSFMFPRRDLRQVRHQLTTYLMCLWGQYSAGLARCFISLAPCGLVERFVFSLEYICVYGIVFLYSR